MHSTRESGTASRNGNQPEFRPVELPAYENIRLVFDSASKISERDYLAFCRANPDLRCERNAEGEIVIVPPAGGEGSYRSGKTYSQLDRWAELDGRGRAFDSSVQFTLPDGSSLSPDASWVSNRALERLSRSQRRQFLRLSPEFVIEAMSPSDRLKPAQAKMQSWIANGVKLAWLIDGDRETIHIYRPGRDPVIRRGVRQVAGEGPVRGFILKLDAIWRGLR